MPIITAVTQNDGDGVKSRHKAKITVFTVILNPWISYRPKDIVYPATRGTEKVSLCIIITTLIRRLLTANRSRVSIRGRPCKLFSAASGMITVQNLTVLSRSTPCTHVGDRKNFRDAAEAPLNCDESMADPLETRSCRTCVTEQNFIDRSNH